MKGNKGARADSQIGVVVITKNEEEDLPAFFENLSAWVREIVVVDDDSSDGTEACCRAAGANVRLVRHGMSERKDFAEQRNIGIEHATSEFLLHMDADERVSGRLRSELEEVVASGTVDAVRFRRKNFFLQRHFPYAGLQRWNQVHFARRGVLRFEGRVHERPVLLSERARVVQAKGEMIHLNDASFDERLTKSLGYCRLEASRIVDSGKRVGVRQLLGAALWRFLRAYVLDRGFLLGVPGLIHGIHQFSSSFYGYALAWDAQNPVNRGDLEAEWRRGREEPEDKEGK